MKRSESGLFLIELLIVITVFAVCAAICVRIFTSAYLAGTRSRDLSHALNVAKSAAEVYKSTGDIGEAAEVLGGSFFEGEFTPSKAGGETAAFVYYDEYWKLSDAGGGSFVLILESEPGAPLPTCVLTVYKMNNEDEFVSLTVAARGRSL